MDSEGFHVLLKPSLTKSDDDVVEKSPCGRYVRFKKILGRGAFKDAYKGFDLVNNVEIAWSQTLVDDVTALTSQENQEKLFSEAVLLQSSNHRNIMKCYSFWLDYDNKVLNMITESFPSGSVRQYTKKLGRGIDVETIKNWGRQILQGLLYLHTQNPCIVHRNLKCDNIFIDVGKSEVKIGDFGFATAMEHSPLKDPVGTPKFMAPEYYDEEYNELVDIYAFGMCLMEMATCEYPYSECTNGQIFKKVYSGKKPVALGKVKDVDLKEIIEKCLLPASLRPSAMELLNDPFFSSGIPVETDSSLMTEPMDKHSQDEYFRAESCRMDDVILAVISASFKSVLDANCSKLQRAFLSLQWATSL
ncbi:MEKK [Handroanthus impetiginosus]|uniref:non-specific serine/threonine protein kinase n=1 Tax=Handroanthus impetiginosus TaxID=429701 RepID=A0A2G9FYL4_9LAMI|nr:MEKK [Handroanthus impetiginosus]